MQLGVKDEDIESRRESLDTLFDVFDYDGNGIVDNRELLSGLSIVCGGASDAKIKAAFALCTCWAAVWVLGSEGVWCSYRARPR